MTLLKMLFVCSVLFVAVVPESVNSEYEKWKFNSDNEEIIRVGFVRDDLKYCRPGDKVIPSQHDPWITSLLTNKLKEIQNDNAVRQATKINENEEYHKRIRKHLAANPYSMVDLKSLPNLEIESDDLSTQEHANNRVKRMNENEEIDHKQLQANIEEVFKTSLDSSKFIDNNILDEVSENDPALRENINNVFGSAPSERLLAQNDQNFDSNNKNHLNELHIEELDSTIEDYDSTTKKTNLNEMILKNFGPEMLDDDPESTTEYRFRDITTLLGKHKNMTATNNHHATSTNKESISGGGHLSSSTKNPDADTDKAASRSSGGLACTWIPYLITLVLILLKK